MFDPRTLRAKTFRGLGGIEDAVIGLAGAALTAGAGVGSAFIVADAQKDVSRRDAATQLQIALKTEETNLAIARLGVEQTGQVAQVATQAVSTGGAVLGLALLAGLLLGGSS